VVADRIIAVPRAADNRNFMDLSLTRTGQRKSAPAAARSG